VIDAVRCAKLALDRGIGGPLLGPSAYFMKSPPVQYTDGEARDLVADFIADEVSEITKTIQGNGHRNGNGHLDLQNGAAIRTSH
ncbi:MAG TPA: hypothetical protein VFS18_04890, partial [Actinomycetota bacterium]|nr:hypothetical protein [Actinomycetota bacterium]